MYKIPNENKKLVQTNENDLFGNIYVTKNIDLRNNGYIKLSHFPFAKMTEDDDADFTSGDAMGKSTNEIFLNASEVFSGSGGYDVFLNRKTDTQAPTPGVEEDVLYFNNTEVITDGDYLYYRSNDTEWTRIDLDLVGTVEMAIQVTSDSLVVGSGNTVRKINKSWVTTHTLTIPTDYTITAIDTNGNTIYIGTKHKANGEAVMLTWDGDGADWNNCYGVDANEILSIRKYGASCVLVTSKGQLLQFNGGSFNVLGNFPVYNEKDTVDWSDSLNDHDKVSNRGLYVDKDKIYITADTTNKVGYNSYSPSGVYCYTPENGLFCLNTPSYNRITTKTVAYTSVNTTDNTVTTTGVPPTGTVVKFDIGATTIGGLNQVDTYYTIKVSDTVFKLATSYSNAISGTAIDLTSQGTGNHKFYFFPIYDYGHSYIKNRSSVLILGDGLNGSSNYTDKIIYTADLQLPAKMTLCQTVPNIPNRGYLITIKLNSSNNEDLYNEIVIKHKPLRDDEKIIIKYRTVEKVGLPFGSLDKYRSIVGTWTDTDTFTTTLDMSNASVGDEVEIVAGKGAGILAHISSLTENAGTWTVNLDETFPTATNGETMYFYVNNFQKLGEINKESTEGIDYLPISLDKNSKFLQLKVELRGVDVTIEELKIKNTEYKK